MSKNRPPSQRQLKAGEVIRRALAEIIAKEHLREPALKGVSITISEVRASADLRHAIVFAAPLGGGDMDEVIAALNKCAKFFRGKLGKEMEMKSTPALKFMADTTFEYATDMQNLFNKPDVKRDLD